MKMGNGAENGTLENMRLRLLNEQLLYKDLIEIQKSIKFVVSLDIGGGNCSASALDIAEMKKQKGDDKLNAIISLHTQPKAFSTPSAVGYRINPDGEGAKVLIGKAAAEEADEIFTNYKTVPTDANLSATKTPDGRAMNYPFSKSVRELMTDYIRALYQSILSTEADILCGCSRDEILVLVGVPSDEQWQTEEARRNFKEIIVEATGGDPEKAEKQVWLMSESDASILYMMGKYPKKGMDRLMIVDLGAYSADITYIDRTSGRRCKMSIKLGGKEIDRIIKEEFIEGEMSEADRERIRENVLDYFVRMGKEGYWPQAEKDAQFSIFADEDAYVVSKRNMDQCVTIKPFSCKSVAGEAAKRESYTGHLRLFLKDFVSSHQDIKPDVMLIVGGAANMRPAYDAIIEFCDDMEWKGEDGNRIDVYPKATGLTRTLTSYAVPEGMLVYYVKTMMYIEKLPQVNEKLIKCAKDHLYQPLCRELGEKLPDCLFHRKNGVVVLAAREWAKNGENYDGLIDLVVKEMQTGSKMQKFYSGIIPPIVELFIGEAQKTLTEAAEGFLPGGMVVRKERKEQMTGEINAAINENTARNLKSIISVLNRVISEEMTTLMICVIPAILVGIGIIFVEMIKGIQHLLFESEEEKKARIEKEIQQQKRSDKESKERQQAERMKKRSEQERRKIYDMLSSPMSVNGKYARSCAKKEIKKEIPEALKPVFEGESIDDVIEALMSSLQEELEFAAFM